MSRSFAFGEPLILSGLPSDRSSIFDRFVLKGNQSASVGTNKPPDALFPKMCHLPAPTHGHELIANSIFVSTRYRNVNRLFGNYSVMHTSVEFVAVDSIINFRAAHRPCPVFFFFFSHSHTPAHAFKSSTLSVTTLAEQTYHVYPPLSRRTAPPSGMI